MLQATCLSFFFFFYVHAPLHSLTTLGDNARFLSEGREYVWGRWERGRGGRGEERGCRMGVGIIALFFHASKCSVMFKHRGIVPALCCKCLLSGRRMWVRYACVLLSRYSFFVFAFPHFKCLEGSSGQRVDISKRGTELQALPLQSVPRDQKS